MDRVGTVVENNEVVFDKSSESEPVEQKDTEPKSFREALNQEIKKANNEPKEPKVEVKPEAKEQIKAQIKAEVKDTTPAPVVTPADMKPEEAEAFKNADPKLKEYLSRRAYENRVAISREMQKAHDIAKKHEHIERELAPHRDWLAKKGIDEAVVARRAIAWEKAFETDRIGAAKEYLAAQGIDPYELVDESGETQPQPQNQQLLTPEQVEQMIAERLERERQTNYQEQTTSQNYNLVERFKENKPLFRDPATAQALENEMTPLVAHYAQSMSPDKALEKAYEVVTKGNEQFSSLLNSYSQRQQAEKAKQEAEKAKATSRFISGGMQGSSRSSEGLTMKEELRLRLNGSM